MRNAMHIGPSAGSRDRRQALVLAVTGRIVRPNPAKPLHDSCAARLTPRTHKRGRRDGGKRSQSGAASRPGASTAKATSTHEGPRQGGRPASSTGACRDGPARGRAHTVRPPPPSLEGPYATKDTVSGAAARLYSRTRLKTRQATTRAHGTAAIAPICHSAASPRSPERQWRKPRRRMRARGKMAGPRQALVLAATGLPGGRSTPAPPLSLATSGSTGASRSWSHLETKTQTRAGHSGYSADLPQRRVASQPGASMAKTTPTHEGPREDGRPASSTGACRDRPARGAEYARPPPQSRDQRQHWC